MAESVSWRRSCVKSESNKSIDDFSRNATRLQRLVYKDTEEFRSELCSILKEINAIDYSACHQSEEVSPFVRVGLKIEIHEIHQNVTKSSVY